MGYDGSLKFDTEINETGFSSGVKKIGSIAKKGMAVAAGAVAGCVTAFGALSKASLDAVSRMEQNIGGVETLFKDSADAVIENANRAYTTAGMSANDYMSTVTSFSASLLQSLSGDTKAAAEIADMAIIDMSDNANKMGTSMESIQNAYQGFAKQNYTMLDNLKLGYGGTKTEMERLLADAQKISGVEYNIDNLNDVFSAIHVIQEELGITGTTAEEAATTIEGSMNSAKAAWDNFLAGSGTADELAEAIGTAADVIVQNLGEIVPRLVETVPEAVAKISENLSGTIQEKAPEMIQAGKSVVSNVVSGFMDFAPSMMEKAIDLAEGIASGIEKGAPKLMQEGTSLIKELSGGISNAIPKLVPLALSAVLSLAQGFVSAMPTLFEAAAGIIQGLGQGIVNAIPILIEKVPQIINDFFAAFDDGLITLVVAGANVIKNIVTGIIQNIPLIKQNIGEIALAIINIISHINLFNAAKGLMTSLSNGIKSMSQTVFGNAKGIAQNIWNGITNFDWFSLGKNVIQFVANGVKSLAGMASTAASAIGSGMLTTIQNVNWLQLGKAVVTKIVSGLLSLGGKMGSTALQLAQRALTAFKCVDWLSVGKNIVNGIVSGIGAAAGYLFDSLRNLASNALKAAKNALGIKSPSRVFRDEVGKHIVTGIVEGINKMQGALTKRMKSLSDSTVATMKSSVGKGDFSSAGKTIVNKISSAITAQQKKTTKSLENLVDGAIDSISKKKKYKKYSKTFSKIGDELIDAMSDSIKKKSQKIVDETNTIITNLSNSYQSAYDSLISSRNSMQEKITDVSNLYDLDTQLEQIKRYQNGLNSLKGKIPDSLMQEILGMDISDADNFAEYLNSLTDSELQSYIQKWNKIQDTSNQYSKKFFQNDIDNLKKDYNAKIEKSMADAKKKMEDVGKNVAKGMIEGLKSQTKNMGKEIQKIAKQMIKDFRKAFDINSPSGVMEDEIGRFLPPGVAKGFVKAMPRAEKTITDSMLQAMNTLHGRLNNLQSTSVVAFSGVSTAPVVNVTNSQPVHLQAEIHTSVDLDGRSVGRGVTQYVNEELADWQNREKRGS